MSSQLKSIELRRKAAFLEPFLEKHASWVLWAIFGVSILSKIWIIPRLGAVSFPNSDEHIFIELAKSFFYNHNFSTQIFNYIKQYNEILFPLVLSPTYWLFSARYILIVFRSYGLLLISLAAFPAYWLGLQAMANKKQALLLALMTILLPEIALAFTVGQETLYYPLFLLAMALVYKKIQGDRVSPVILGIVFFLLLICKAVGVTVMAAYVAYMGFELVFVNKFKNYKSFLLQLVVVVVLVFVLKETLTLVIRYLNTGSFAPVSDFYNKVLTKFLHASPALLLSDIPNGILYYLFYTTIACMVFPLVLVIDYFKQFAARDQKFLIFLGFCYLATLATVTMLVYMDEGGAAKEVQRVHFRYFFPLMIPLIMMLLKIDFSKVQLGEAGVALCSFVLLYELIFRPTFRSGSIIDSKSLLFLEWVNAEITHGFNLVFLCGAFGLAYLGWLVYRKLNSSRSRRLVISVLMLGLFANQTYATYKTYTYYTVQTYALERKYEYIVISQLVGSQPGTPLLLYPYRSFWPDVVLTTQSNKDFSRADFFENILEYNYDPAYPPNFIITPKDLLNRAPLRNAARVAPQLRLFDVYQVSGAAEGKVSLDYSLVNVHSDGWLQENAQLLISGNGRGNEAGVTLSIITASNAPRIETVVKDTTGAITTIPIDPNGSTFSFVAHKNAGEKDFAITLGANGFFIPKELAGAAGGNDDTRKLTYQVKQITIQ